MAKLEIPIVIDDKKLHEIIDDAVAEIKENFVMKDKVEAALAEIIDGIEPEYITDSSGDIHGYMSDYERGLHDAAQIIYKHVGEDLKQ